MESMMAPTRFTQEFLDSDFTPYQYFLEDIKDGDTPAVSDLAAVEIPSFDTHLIESINQHARSHGVWAPIPSQAMWQDWHNQPQSWGWSSVNIKHIPLQIETLNSIVDFEWDIDADETLTSLCRALFNEVWHNLVSLKVMKMLPGGWIHPHRDMLATDWKLCNFWMPLHEFHGGLKIMPWGWLRHSVGNMYLLNSRRYPHAAINPLPYDRLVMIGKFDLTNIPERIQQQFLANRGRISDLFYH